MLKSHLEVIDQALSLISEIDNESLSQVISPYFSGSIGQHLRHVVDHYVNLFNGIADGLVNYNRRNRFCSVETSIDDCRKAFHDVQAQIVELTAEQLTQTVSVITEISISEHDDALVESNVDRELVFISSHAIHHYAMIKIIRQMQGAQVPANFGFAPATLTYLREQAG